MSVTVYGGKSKINCYCLDHPFRDLCLRFSLYHLMVVLEVCKGHREFSNKISDELRCSPRNRRIVLADIKSFKVNISSKQSTISTTCGQSAQLVWFRYGCIRKSKYNQSLIVWGMPNTIQTDWPINLIQLQGLFVFEYHIFVTISRLNIHYILIWNCF